jgi:hypothetical protein
VPSPCLKPILVIRRRPPYAATSSGRAVVAVTTPQGGGRVSIMVKSFDASGGYDLASVGRVSVGQVGDFCIPNSHVRNGLIAALSYSHPTECRRLGSTQHGCPQRQSWCNSALPAQLPYRLPHSAVCSDIHKGSENDLAGPSDPSSARPCRDVDLLARTPIVEA